MSVIMCASILRKALKGAAETPATPDGGRGRRLLLGNWAATLIRVENSDLVVALNERTYLTVVFPLTPVAAFRRAFSDALATALLDHGVTATRTSAECSQVEAAPIVPLSDRRLQMALDTAGFIAAMEVACCDSLREVQWNLNQFPHESIRPFVPTQQVRLLFDSRNGHRTASFSRRVTRIGNRDCVDALLRTRAASERIAAAAETWVPDATIDVSRDIHAADS